MIGNQEEDEFTAVRVQDPRIQNEGSWNSYVDYKIFLHTNSKAFTAKTSCVRRRYSEFAWLKKKLQKNSGLVPVPDLPRKSLFSFSNEDFLEGRRKGLQAFLDKVVNMTVCLSDSQLHLFLQTQLPVGHIQDCVQGHTPYTVTDAILTYASSNQGFAQAQEEDAAANKEPSLTVSYESMESPAPHQPCLQTEETLRPELLCFSDSDPLEGLVPLCDSGTAEPRPKEKSSMKALQKENHQNFFLGDGRDGSESLGPAERPPLRGCRMQALVEVHTPNGGVDGTSEGSRSPSEESDTASDTEENAGAPPDAEGKADRREAPEEAEAGSDSADLAVLDFKDGREDVVEEAWSEGRVLENQVIPDVGGVDGTEGQDVDVGSTEEVVNSDGQNGPHGEKSAESESRTKTPNESDIPDDAADTHDDDAAQPTGQKQAAREPDLAEGKDESDEDDEDADDSHSLLSSNESIVKVSDEESVGDEAKDAVRAEDAYMKTCRADVPLWSEVEACGRNILDLRVNGSPAERDDIVTLEDGEDLRYVMEIGDFGKSQDIDAAVAGGDLTENSDFSILATSCSPVLADGELTVD